MNPSQLVECLRNTVVVDVNRVIMDRMQPNGLSTFDHPVAIVHAVSSRSHDPLVAFRCLHERLDDRRLDLIVKDFIEVDVIVQDRMDNRFINTLNYPVIKLEEADWKLFIVDILSSQIYPHLQKTINDNQMKMLSISTQATIGFASKIITFGRRILVDQNPLLNLKHSEETVTIEEKVNLSISSLARQESLTLRSADFCFMLKRYEQSASSYDSLRREMQDLKKWSITASCQFWSILSQILKGVMKQISYNDLDLIVRQFLLAEETQFLAVQIVPLLFEADLRSIIEPELLFPIISRMIQSPYSPQFHLNPILIQTHIIISSKKKKTRILLLLLHKFAHLCNHLGLHKLSIMASKYCVKVIKCDMVYFSPILLNIISTSRKCSFGVEPEFAKLALDCEALHEQQDIEYCWQMLVTFNDLIQFSKGILCEDMILGGRSCSNLQLTINDFSWIRKFCDDQFTSSGKIYDPLQLLLINQEHHVKVGDNVEAILLLQNPFHFVVELSSTNLVCEIDGQRHAFSCQNPLIRLHPKSVTSIVFYVNSSKPSCARVSAVETMIGPAKLKAVLPLGRQRFRINLTKKQRLEKASIPNHAFNILFEELESSCRIRCLSSGADDTLYVYQECLFEFDVPHEIIERVFIFSDIVKVVDLSTDIGNRLVSFAPTSNRILLNAVPLTMEDINISIAIKMKGLASPRLFHKTFVASQLLSQPKFVVRTMARSKYIMSIVLENVTPSSIVVYSCHLRSGNIRLSPVKSDPFEIRSTMPFVISFMIDQVHAEGFKLHLRLQDSRIMVVPIEAKLKLDTSNSALIALPHSLSIANTADFF